MLSVYVQPDLLQVVKGRLRKDNLLEIHEYKSANALHDYPEIMLSRQDISTDEVTEAIKELFEEVRDLTTTKRESIHLVLPDFLFTLVDIFSYETEADFERQVAALLPGRQLTEIYYSIPIKTSPAPQDRSATVYALERDLADIIVAAADKAKVRLFSIEAASLTFLRCSGVYQKEEFVLQAYVNNAIMTGYSSIGGIFKYDVPELSIESLSGMEPDEADGRIRSTIITLESVAFDTFTNINNDIPIVFLGDSLPHQAAFTEREAPRQQFPEFILSDIPETEQQDWMCAVGTLLQTIDFPNDDYPVIIDDYQRISSGNILPADVQIHVKTYQLMDKLKRGSILGISILSAVFAIETIGIMALSAATVPENLTIEYNEAKQDSEDIDKELATIEEANKEHQYPVEAVGALLENKPDGLGFLNLNIGTEGKNDHWIKLKVAAEDPMFIQDYIAALQRDDRISGASYSQIDKNPSNGVNTADIVAGKGEVTE